MGLKEQTSSGNPCLNWAVCAVVPETERVHLKRFQSAGVTFYL